MTGNITGKVMSITQFITQEGTAILADTAEHNYRSKLLPSQGVILYTGFSTLE
jgi:hypothetical protein